MRKKQQALGLINVRIYRYWQALYMAFYSRRLYVDVAKRWRGFGFFYLLLLIAVAIIPLSTRIMLDINRYVNEEIISPIENIPALRVQNGEVLFDKPMPYLIKNKMGSVVVMIDTSDTVKGMDAAYPELMMLITRTKLYFRKPEIKLFFKTHKPSAEAPVVEDINTTSSETFAGKAWVKSSGIIKIKWFLMSMVYPMMLPFFFGLFFTFLLILSMLAQVFSWLILKFKIKFSEAARLLIVASTAQICVCFFLVSFNLLFKGAGLLFIALIAMYFSYGVLSVKRESNLLVRV